MAGKANLARRDFNSPHAASKKKYMKGCFGKYNQASRKKLNQIMPFRDGRNDKK